MPNRAARPANCIRTGAPPVANLEHDAVCRTSSPHQNVMVTCSPSTDDVSSAQQPPAPSTTLSASAPIGFELKPTLSNVHGCSTSPARTFDSTFRPLTPTVYCGPGRLIDLRSSWKNQPPIDAVKASNVYAILVSSTVPVASVGRLVVVMVCAKFAPLMCKTFFNK